MKTIKHKENREVEKICNNCKHFEKRKNRGVGGGLAFIRGSFCHIFKSIISKDSTCNKWEVK